MKDDSDKVYYCARRDATPLKEWNSFSEMLIEEIQRLRSIHNNRGIPQVDREKDSSNRLSKTRRSAEQHRSRHYNWGSADRLLSIEDDRYGLTQYSYSPSGELAMA